MTLTSSVAKLKAHVHAEVEALDKLVPGCSWGTYPGHDPSEALASDAMIPKWTLAVGILIGNRLAALQWSRRRKSGLWYQIWRGQIRSMTYESAGWRPYFDRNSANPSRSHKNHVHGSWYAKAPVAVKPKPPAPAPAEFAEGWSPALPWVFYLDRQSVGLTGSRSVWLIQKALGRKPYDGIYTMELRAAVQAWQRDVLKDTRANCDGILGPKQAKALFGPLVRIEAKS